MELIAGRNLTVSKVAELLATKRANMSNIGSTVKGSMDKGSMDKGSTVKGSTVKGSMVKGSTVKGQWLKVNG